jgi:hypothetical protein
MILAAGALCGLGVRLGVTLWSADGPTAFVGMACLWGGVGGGLWQRCDPGWRGLVRQILLGAAVAYALWPLLGSRFSGAGDAYDYLLQGADYVAQLRRGIWPVLVGQSDYAFNGSVHTLRTAPAYTHLAGMIDLATGQTLSVLALQKLTLLGSLLGGAGSMYFATRSLLGAARADGAAALAILYVLSPGVLAPLYVGELYATFMTLPWVPWVVVGWVKICEDPARRWGWLAWAVGTGGLWWAHAPTATWGLVITGLGLALAWRPRNWPEARSALTGLGLAAALSGYVFGSVHTLQRLPAHADPRMIRAAIAHNFLSARGIFGPQLRLSVAEIPEGWQIGLGVMGAAALGLALAWRRPVGRMVAALLILGVLGLGAWPALAARGWSLVPGFVVAITGNWAFQRLVGWVAALAVVGAALGLREIVSTRRCSRWAWFGYLGLLIAWSAWQADVYHERARRMMRSTAATAALLAPGRVTLSRATAEVLGAPNAFTSMSRVDPAQEYRLLDLATGQARADGVTLRPGVVRPEQVYALNLTVAGTDMTAQRPVVPAGGGTFRFDFHGGSPQGILEFIEGDGSFDYALNTEGLGSRTVGAESDEHRTFLLRNPDRSGHPVQILFWPWTPLPPAAHGHLFATLQVRPWRSDEQVIQIRSLIPAEIDVQADRAGELETPKFWIPGYRARVDGRPENVVRSPRGLVAVAVPAGNHRVEITYRGPWLLYAAYALALAAWLGVAVGVGARLIRGRDGLGWSRAGNLF